MEYKYYQKKIDKKLIKMFPRKILEDYGLLPVKDDKGIILITEKKPPLPVLDELAVYSNYQLQVKLVDNSIIKPLIDEYLSSSLDSVEEVLDDLDTLEEYINPELKAGVENIEELAQEAPIIQLVNVIIRTAIKKEASDIHIEPYSDKIRLRYRIDGILYTNPPPPRELLPAIVTRIKIMANLNIAERRLPQEGRIRIKVLDRELDIRVSLIPNIYGEGVVLRILDRAAELLNLNNLGFSSKMLVDYKSLINKSEGIILVTGPTGSGKTTTLYASLNHLNSAEQKIITIEDPVEYQLEGITQVAVKHEIDFDFARGLRSFLRHDPDIIMIGEIRDKETAQIAIQAALTGHLVFATLHTNDAASAITRLLDMGVEDYLLASTLKGILAQRLVRLICSSCKTEYQPQGKEARLVKEAMGVDKKIYHGLGCDNCNQIGFKGRTSIYELLALDKELQSLISRGISKNEIIEAARNKGIKSLADNGWDKVKEGITTMGELFRVTR